MYYSFTYVLYLYINIDRCTEPSRSEDAVIVTALGWPGVWMGPGPDPNHLELQLLMAELYLLVFAEFYT